MDKDKILSEWKRYRAQGHPHDVWTDYRTWLWDEINPILQKFIEYVENQDNWEDYGSNCNNHFYYHSGTGYAHLVRWPGTKVMCKIMSTALFFLTDTHGLQEFMQGEHEAVKKLKEFIGCTIVNVFMHILEHTVCEGHWGLQYAWYVMREKMQGIPPNIITEKKCVQGLVQDTHLGQWSMKAKIKDWIQQNTQLSAWVQDTAIKRMCSTAQEKSKEAGRKGTEEGTWRVGADNTDNYGEQEVREKLETGIKHVIGSGMHDIMQKMGAQLDAGSKPTKTGQPGTGAGTSGSGTNAAGGTHAPTTKPGAAQQDSNKDTRSADDNTHENKSKDTDTPGGPPAAAAAQPAAATPATTHPVTAGAGDQKGARPSAPSAEGTSATGDDGTQNKTLRDIPQDSSAECKGKDGANGPGSSGSPSAPAEAAPKASDPAASDPTSPSTGPETKSTGTGGYGNTSAKNDDDSGDAVVAGGNDDPPPLNPPKPKPNPNPNQSGSSGGFSDSGSSAGGGGAPGSGGGGGGSESAQKDASSNSNSGSSSSASVLLIDVPRYADGTGGHFGTGPTPDPHDTSSSTPKEGGPLAPDLTDTVLTATTPVLFFLSAVTVALLGYSLWTYFAHLGKQRRRTYRTVRDVPSPPLDAEILAHLQRGELPPPDYGYTMIRDRQPGRLPARRRRHPRVHKRTIIELHLEVLHECEATEWENVKDDYWQILVEQFAQELMRDANEYSSSPASSSNHDSPGTNVSSMLDPPTDSNRIHPCPPHDPDPCSCVDTMHLATDPCTPNEEDPDPWSCMETIQLAMDTSPPNDPDPWGCMETIQLETDPSASNEEDRWNCMENIQLAPDPCPPNEEDPDPWSCMETIQLPTDRSPPNAEHRWKCMENIDLDAQQHAHSNPAHATSYCIHWINWIDRHKYLLQDCTTQPWFLQLKSEWKQYLREHMVANGASGEHTTAATMETQKLDLWKEWVAHQHALMHIYGEEPWFQHLLNNVEEETVPEKGATAVVDKDLEVEKVMGTEDVLQVRDAPCTQLHQPPHMKKVLTALKLWMLLLASVIEQCERECRLQEKELYVDDLLEKL
ncbi:hypothetical protein AK88_02985 [Plasmodium fragile]|uniref:Schizont-infected cell agglutination C-terminal domain-containing protein n=1 Tax=Plasmodium fragile TaxID=5857 RepID=A0A0D9QJR6_PLAFR|nr:uncharacterized protein AK88_02985 [Plasmodium fragile]KJP87305.1 hypothetical protein AK88_02985 [Plasmodium fragile]